MNTFNIVMPKLGESVQEATITNWFVKVGDRIDEDQSLLEVATDKVDSEIPSPVDGVIREILFDVDAVVPVGTVIAVLEVEGELESGVEEASKTELPAPAARKEVAKEEIVEHKGVQEDDRFYSPLVRKIAQEHQLSSAALSEIQGSGLNGRVNKDDILTYLASGKKESKPVEKIVQTPAAVPPVVSLEDEVIPLDRMRKLIAEHMVHSKHVAPHVTTIIEVDVTPLVEWRNKNKDSFLKMYGQKLTFMPLFVEATARALRDFPRINASLVGDNLIVKKQVNIGLAVALPSGNLIVPVIKAADQKNVAGLAAAVNDLAAKARANKLGADDIQGGTFTITNFGSFKSLIGTPIINQPEVAILATGTIEKKVSVVETLVGDVIAIRHKMFLSLSHDHRVVDGMLGGSFLRRIGDYLEGFDTLRDV